MSTNMTPREIVQELDKHIIGQSEAKRAVAIALRNRWRRMQLEENMAAEITPKNILMIGPTGVGKTEIARRLAKLAGAPFVKVEATKFTEVGYVGREVDSIIKDLVGVAVKDGREKAMAKVKSAAEDVAEDRILDALLPMPKHNYGDEPAADNDTRQKFRKKLREGELDDKEIEFEISARPIGVEIMAPPGMEEMTNQLQGMFQNLSSEKTRTKKMKVKDALKAAIDEESARLINDDEIKQAALQDAEQNGIVFIDEIDKVTRRDGAGADVSREGVQRDLLPLVEGCTVTTKYGPIKTDHILFIASGAFHLSKPSDLVPELQGRLPIRVELRSLSAEDFQRILIEPDYSLTEQYSALLETESVNLTFNESGMRRIAELAWHVNDSAENIGARRLHTMMERLLETVSYDASDLSDKNVLIDDNYVNEHLEELTQDQDLSRFIL